MNREKITFNMASFPPRIQSMEETLASIYDQADEINIYLNNYKYVPDYLIKKKINVFRSQDEYGDIGDVGKFFCYDKWEGYILTVDDKLIYDRNYAKLMIESIEKFKRKAVISCHGRIFNPGKSPTYYHDCKEFLGCLMTIHGDRFVHEIGTGAMAFHTDTWKPDIRMFKRRNMTDIYVSIDLNDRGIPRVVRDHKEGFIRGSRKFDYSQSISTQLNKRDIMPTELVNSCTWTIAKC